MLVGMDIGYSGLKVAFGTPGKPRREKVLPVGAAPAADLGTNFMTTEKVGVRVLVNGTEYIAGIDPGITPGEGRGLNRGYTDTPVYRALFHAALLTTQAEHIHRLVTGLPVSVFLNKPKREKLRRALEGRHQVAPGREVFVESAVVVPQPAGTFVAYADADKEAMAFLSDKTVLVIDPGFFSVDSVVLHNNVPYPNAATTSVYAMSKVLARADESITRQFEDEEAPLGTYSGRMEKALQQGVPIIYVAGSSVEFIPFVERAAEVEAERAINAILDHIRHLNGRIDVVLLTGGGANFFAPVVKKHFPRQKIEAVHNAPVANAHGFLSMARTYYDG